MGIKHLIQYGLLVMLVILSGCGQSVGGDENTIFLRWSTPVANEDGSALEDLSGFKVYYGTDPGELTEIVDVGNTPLFPLPDLSPGTWYFAVTAYDMWDNESDRSKAISYTVLDN